MNPLDELVRDGEQLCAVRGCEHHADYGTPMRLPSSDPLIDGTSLLMPLCGFHQPLVAEHFARVSEHATHWQELQERA